MSDNWTPKEVDRRHRSRTSPEARITSLVELILNDPEKAAQRLASQLRDGSTPAVVTAQLDGAAEVCRRRRINPQAALDDIRKRLSLWGYSV